MTNLDNQIEIAKLERLIKIQECLFQASKKVVRLKSNLDSKDWFLFNRNEAKHDLEIAQMASDRLFAYYAKKVFALASHTSRMATQRQLAKMPTSKQILEPIESICNEFLTKKQ